MYYELEDGSGNYELEDGSGFYELEQSGGGENGYVCARITSFRYN